MPLTDQQARRIVEVLYREDELYGCIVGYEGDGQSRVLSAGFSPSVNFARVVVVITEGPSPVDLSHAPAARPGAAPQPVIVQEPQLGTANRDRITAELVGTGLSCGMAAISAVGVFGGAAAEVPTAGASTVVVVLAWSGLVTSGAQCVNGIVRSAEAIINPEQDSLHRWDQNTVYSTAFLIVDGLGIASGVASLPAAGRNLWAVLSRRGSLMTIDEFGRLSGPARKRAIQEALEQASRTDAGRREVLAALRETGLTSQQARNLLNYGTSTTRQAERVLGALSSNAAARVNGNLADILNTAAGIGVSATPSSLTGSGSGAANALIVHVSERE